MEWLTSKGALVWVPMGHSPDVDLMAELEGRLVRVQVKTSTMQGTTVDGQVRWRVSIATNGGNRSWGGVTKKFDPTRVDYLFVLVGDGRRWFVPAWIVEGSRSIALGGAKYSEFEIERGTPFEGLVYPDEDTNRIGSPFPGECQSGQMVSTVNRAAMPTQVRILPPPSSGTSCGDSFGRQPRASGHALLRPKRQATIPKRPCEEAGLRPGDRMRVHADGPGRVVLERIDAVAETSLAVEAAA
jgi:PD-(D/E)XK nuclease superfamily protein